MDWLKDGESLFLNMMELDFDYVPRVLKYREKQQQHMAACIKPLLNERDGTNLLITGKTGIGQRVAVRQVFGELEQETQDIIPIYINCWKKDTFYKIILHICEKIGYKWVHNKKSDELFKEACKILNKKKVVFCFDEVDKLEEQDILYHILEEVHKKTIFLITNEKDWLTKMDQRIVSKMNPEILEFEPYNYDETKGVLEQRKDTAFVQNVWEDEAFEKIVEKTIRHSEIKIGLFLLHESGNVAEEQKSKKITKKHVEKAIKKFYEIAVKNPEAMKDEKVSEILTLIKENEHKGVEELYEIYKEKNHLTFESFKEIINLLEKKRWITIE